MCFLFKRRRQNQITLLDHWTSLLKQCPLCEKTLRAHRIGLVAGAILGTEKGLKLVESFGEREWSHVVTCFEMDMQADLVEVFAVGCPSGRVGTLLVYSPFDLFLDDRVDAFHELSSPEAAEIGRHVKQWETLAASEVES